jgi:peptidoglycan/xylan/chitin deacetylase (PgdA/CDA1 family)
LEAHGYRGTYYISSGLIGSPTAVGQVPSLDTIKDFHGRGHEIGNHTYEHLDCRKEGFWSIVGSVRRNSKVLAEVMSGSFAYPYGSVDARVRIAARLCATSARGTSFGINRNIVDLMHLRAARVYDRCGIDNCLDLVKECSEEGGWLIFYTHDVCDEPSEFGCTPEQLTRLVESVSNNKLAVATVVKSLQLIEQKSGRKV